MRTIKKIAAIFKANNVKYAITESSNAINFNVLDILTMSENVNPFSMTVNVNKGMYLVSLNVAFNLSCDELTFFREICYLNYCRGKVITHNINNERIIHIKSEPLPSNKISYETIKEMVEMVMSKYKTIKSDSGLSAYIENISLPSLPQYQ